MDAFGHAVMTRDLFLNFKKKKLKMTIHTAAKFKCDSHKDDLIHKIFRSCVDLVVNDIIENNATFNFPTGKKRCVMHLSPISDEKFIKMRQHGAFRDVDFLASNFTGYKMMMEFESNGKRKKRTVHVGAKYRDRITEYTNQGRQYF